MTSYIAKLFLIASFLMGAIEARAEGSRTCGLDIQKARLESKKELINNYKVTIDKKEMAITESGLLKKDQTKIFMKQWGCDHLAHEFVFVFDSSKKAQATDKDWLTQTQALMKDFDIHFAKYIDAVLPLMKEEKLTSIPLLPSYDEITTCDKFSIRRKGSSVVVELTFIVVP